MTAGNHGFANEKDIMSDTLCALAHDPYQHVVRASRARIVDIVVDVNVDETCRSTTSMSTFTATWSASVASSSFKEEPWDEVCYYRGAEVSWLLRNYTPLHSCSSAPLRLRDEKNLN